MANPTFSTQGWVARLIANARRLIDAGPSDVTGPRILQYGEQAVTLFGASNHALVDEGSYFVISNATPGTGLATIAAPTAFAATSPFLIVQNNDPIRSLYLDYLRLTPTAAGTAGTAVHLTTVIDYISRYSSGATLIVGAAGATGGQIVNPKSSVANPASISAWAGPLVAVAAGVSNRMVSPDLVLKNAIPAVGDQYTVKFGAVDTPTTTVGVAGHAAVVLDPGASILFHLWLPSQSAASSYEFEVGGWLR
jgi:hypothetical protein